MKRSFQIKMPKVETFDKSLVIEQVTDVFHDKGFNATSMQDIVDATGLNRSSIYNSFENKHNLFLECLIAYQDKNRNRLSERVLKAGSSIEAINMIFKIYLEEITKHENDKGCLIVNCASEMANHNEVITRFLQNNKDEMIKLFEDLVQDGQVNGLINKRKSANEYGLYLYSSLLGFRMTGILISDRTALESITKTITQTLT
ncbi:TetR/AcrR family transcriptional regulator [Seonamhaeicola sp.]|uniref:TetR/AcrR family transcriptional regulator n=1 Tax=Seonamhaeicola sp. TaxID=1912245 RepID=UPI00260C7838|nr:TetR/AcrR family transcriptional regulator [Seonamhaeicola sp.]